jgi:hypothetical protein
MTATVDAIYEHGKIVLPRPLSLPEKSHVRVTIESGESPAMLQDNDTNDLINQLTAMAKDPQIQRELRLINAEFATAESDGLGKL